MILLFIVSRHIFFFPLIPVACVENFLSPVRIRVGCGELEAFSVCSIFEPTV